MNLSEICNIKKNKHKIKDVPAVRRLKFSKKNWRKVPVVEIASWGVPVWRQGRKI